MKQFFRKHKSAFIILSVILVTALLVGVLTATTGLVGWITNANPFGNRDRNEDNLISVESYKALDGTKSNGIKIEVDEDGVITLDGEAEADTTISLGNQSISNDKPSFFFFSGAVGGDIDSYYMTLECSELQSYLVIRSVNTNDTQTVYFEPYGDVYQVGISIVIKEGTELNNVKFYPVLSKGEQISFFE